jgi:glycosyltransferase involved in cell wall biosynthesis
MQCSIVVRAFNESQHLGRLLEGITHQTLKDVEVILVDSGSTDSTVQIAQDFGARVVHISADEFSFGGALNLGLRAAMREHVVIASAHVHPVYPDWLECLLRPFEDDLVAVVYGKQRGAESSRFSEHQILRQWFPEHDITRQASPFCNNANAAIRRSLWEQHPYDETLTALEDVAWAKWAQEQGYHVSYAAHAEIIHVHNETPRGVLARYRREAMAFKRIFPEAHFSIYDFARLTLKAISSDFSHAVKKHAPWRDPGSILWFRIAQFWGTYQGYRHSSPVTQQLRETFYYPRGYDRRVARERDVERIRYQD